MPTPLPARIPQLYNLNHNSTTVYEDTRVIDSNGEVKLTHIPKVGSVTITNIPGMFYTADPTLIGPQQFNVKFNNEYDYIGADRKVRFHLSKAGYTVKVSYIIAASPVDADVINPLIAFVNNFTGNHYTMDDLANPGMSEVSWQNVVDKPVNVTTDVDGLMSHLDKQKLDSLDATVKHVAKFKVDSVDLLPGTAEVVEIVSSGTIKPVVNRDGKLQFDLIPPTITGTPTVSYVLSTDTRLSDARTPKTHQHAMMDVTGLSLALDTKAAKEHKHKWNELEGTLPAAVTMGLVNTLDPRLFNARTPTVHTHNAVDITDLALYLEQKADIFHEHSMADLIDVDEFLSGNGIPCVAPSDLFEGNFVAYGLDVHADAGINAHMWMGAAYVNDRRIHFGDNTFFKVLGPRVPVTSNCSDNTAYPIIRGQYSGSETSLSYMFRVATPNLFNGKFDGLTVEWKRSDELTWRTAIATTSKNTEMEHGLSFRMNMEGLTQYTAGDQWVSQIAVGQTLYIDLEDNGEIAWNYVPAAAAAPPVRHSAMRLAKLTTDGATITGITDYRVGKKFRGSFEIPTPPNTSNSNEVATTAYVVSKINEVVGTPAAKYEWDTIPCLTDDNSLQVPVGARFSDLKGYKFEAMIRNPLSVDVTYSIKINGLNTSADYKTSNALPIVPAGGIIRITGVCDNIEAGPAMVDVNYAISNGSVGRFTVFTSSPCARLENVGFAASEIGAFATYSYLRGIEQT